MRVGGRREPPRGGGLAVWFQGRRRNEEDKNKGDKEGMAECGGRERYKPIYNRGRETGVS